MRSISLTVLSAILTSAALLGCSGKATMDRTAEKAAVIVTPTSYYTTEKGRALGNAYAANLRKLVVRINEDETTRSLTLANNIESPGGLGFFTHSEVRHPDERFLEVVATAPDILDPTQEIRAQINSIMSKYGPTLLEVLLDDSAIYGDERVSGYGLNLGWRESEAAALSDARFVLYLSKEKARRFVEDRISTDGLVVFELRDGQWIRTGL